MPITNFIPTIWSENLSKRLNEKYIGVAHCNRSFEGDIKEKGSVVNICGLENIKIGFYNKNSDMSDPQSLSDTVIEMPIDEARYFNFQVDDIDRAQAMPHLMDTAMRMAASSLANEADRAVFQLHHYVDTRIRVTDPKSDDLINAIIESHEKLYEAGVSDPSEIVIEVNPFVASLLLKAKIDLTNGASSVIETGQIGTLFGAKVFVSNNISSYPEEDCYINNCYVRTTRAIAFAEQLSEIEAYRPEKRFSDAVKGLHLFGTKIVYPSEIVCLEVDITHQA